MSKTKELARALKKLDYNAFYDADLRSLLIPLIDAVLSEPEPLRGWIEVQCAYTNALRTINCKNIVSFGTSKKEQTYIDLVQFNDAIIVQESYDSIKQKIKEAS